MKGIGYGDIELVEFCMNNKLIEELLIRFVKLAYMRDEDEIINRLEKKMMEIDKQKHYHKELKFLKICKNEDKISLEKFLLKNYADYNSGLYLLLHRRNLEMIKMISLHRDSDLCFDFACYHCDLEILKISENSPTNDWDKGIQTCLPKQNSDFIEYMVKKCKKKNFLYFFLHFFFYTFFFTFIVADLQKVRMSMEMIIQVIVIYLFNA